MDKKIENLGKLSGTVLIFGGVYSNLQAFEKLKAYAIAEGIPPENCICTGDTVAFCAQPDECVQLLKNWGVKSIAGNVEIQLRTQSDNCGCDYREGSRCDGFSKLWYPYAQSQLSKDSLDYMKMLPDNLSFEYAGKKIMVVHGSYKYVAEFIYKSTPWEIKQENFDLSQADVIIGGHCGLPFNDKRNDKIWLNSGALGMPANDGTTRVWYATLCDEGGNFNFTHHSLEYDNKLTSKLMKNGLLAEEYSRTIITGIWDNCEILPAAEKGLQGIGIRF